MNLSFLYKYLNGEILGSQLKNQIKENVEFYRLNLQKSGATLPVTIDEDFEFIFKREHLLKLCDAFLNKDLDAVELEYLVDCISLSEGVSFENEVINDYLYCLTDVQINGEITKEKVFRIRNLI